MNLYKLLAAMLLTSVFWLYSPKNCTAQEVGLSFSYFLPKNGYFSTPISPFSFRGLGIDFNDYFGIQTGGTLYRMSGLNVTGLPFESRKPLLGPNFTVLVPVELVIMMTGKSQEFNIKGGGFGFISFDNKLNYGNIDRALKEFEGWLVANADFDFKNSPGFGYHFGAEYIYYFKRFGLSLEANYFIGGASLGLKGQYTGGNSSNTLETKTVDYTDSEADFTGLEISFGILFGS